MAQQREGKAVRDRVLRRVAGVSGKSVSSSIVVVALAAAVCAGIALGSGMAAGDGVVIERGESATDARSTEDEGRADAASGGDGTEGSVEDADAGELVVVDVAGAVASPAVVELDAGSRVADALDAAGGLAADADISSLNRALRVTDGMKIYVPRIGEGGASFCRLRASTESFFVRFRPYRCPCDHAVARAHLHDGFQAAWLSISVPV